MISRKLFAPEQIEILGIVNVTPDSFSDGGQFLDAGALRVDHAVQSALEMIKEGATILDVGGESTRPGAKAVSIEEELSRVIPVIRDLRTVTQLPISVDTRKSEVARQALQAGASIVNDVSGLEFDPVLLEVVLEQRAFCILGHSQGIPETMQENPRYHDVLDEIARSFEKTLKSAVRSGASEEQFVLDPGIGFGKRLHHNLEIMANVEELKTRLGRPILLGPSRKSCLGEVTGDPVDARDVATVAACAIGVFAGASGIRVHEVSFGRRAAQLGLQLRNAKRRHSDA